MREDGFTEPLLIFDDRQGDDAQLETCCCGCNCSCVQSKSCVDWFLPRSNLPLPLLKELAEDRDITLPLPLGAGFVWTELNRNVIVNDLRLGFGSTPPESVDRIDVEETTFHASSKIARFDLWVFPFLNVYGVVGQTTTTGHINLTVNEFPLPISPPLPLDFDVRLEGTTYGGGFTTGIGSKRWFAMLDVNKTWTDFSSLTSKLTALVVTPSCRTGHRPSNFPGAVHIGAMWQDTNQTVELTLPIGSGLHVEVEQIEPRPWNLLVEGSGQSTNESICWLRAEWGDAATSCPV